MPTINRQVQSANLLVIEFDGQQIGVVQTARFSGDFSLTDESGIGDNVVVEYVPGIAHITVSASGILLIQKNLLSAGLMPSNSVRDVLQGNVFDIGLYSRSSGAWLLKAIDCSPASMDIGVNTGRAATYDYSFRARDIAGTLIG
ncbi:hypothetical protein LSG31_00375 [Fodinisporobacter ferrooxydans]|uniref:Uncharacterized protein n=1 Tax=Fodinisporobacter ferrooxydans TaxID=2901836 RepID=A0ABY4CK43_9BACL|nr:hypothetical protein LSG31_00375 [Alicyclobacillaceae bacterium MYW30-H2]